MGAARLDPACPDLRRLRTVHRDQSALLSGPALGEAVRRRQAEDLDRHARDCARCAAMPEPAPAPSRAPQGRGILRRLFGWMRGRPATTPAPAPRAVPPPAARPAPAPSHPEAAPPRPPVRAPLKSGAKKTHRPAAKAAARPPPSSVAPRPAPRPPAPTTLKRHKVPVDPTARALGVLGLAPGADGDAVRKAYRERALLFHPDKVTHLPPDLRAMAEASMRDLNRAYETLQRLGRA